MFFLVFLACTAPTAAPLPTPPAVTTMQPTPTLPDDVFLQLFWPSNGVTYRITITGEYRVTLPGKPEQRQRAMNKYEGSVEQLSPEALKRLHTAILAIDFKNLDQQPQPPITNEVKVNSGQAIQLEPLAISVRQEDQTFTAVIYGDPAAPTTFGALAPLYQTVDREVIGGWMNE